MTVELGSSQASAYLEAAVRRLISKGWLDEIDPGEVATLGDELAICLTVPSEHDYPSRYHVATYLERDVAGCDCTAGSHDRLCKHALLALVFLGLRDTDWKEKEAA